MGICEPLFVSPSCIRHDQLDFPSVSLRPQCTGIAGQVVGPRNLVELGQEPTDSFSSRESLCLVLDPLMIFYDFSNDKI